MCSDLYFDELHTFKADGKQMKVSLQLRTFQGIKLHIFEGIFYFPLVFSIHLQSFRIL